MVVWILDLAQSLCLHPRRDQQHFPMPWQIWERSKTDASDPSGKKASLHPHQTLQPFTFRKRTATNAMVKVIITLAYSSVGNFSRVGKKPCEKRERVSVTNNCSSTGVTQGGGDPSKLLCLPPRKVAQATFLSSSERLQGWFFPPTVYTPLARIFRRLFKWELKVWLFNKDEKLMHVQCMEAGSIQIILLCNLHP